MDVRVGLDVYCGASVQFWEYHFTTLLAITSTNSRDMVRTTLSSDTLLPLV